LVSLEKDGRGHPFFLWPKFILHLILLLHSSTPELQMSETKFLCQKVLHFAYFLKYFPYTHSLPVNLSHEWTIATLANHLIASIPYLYSENNLFRKYEL